MNRIGSSPYTEEIQHPRGPWAHFLLLHIPRRLFKAALLNLCGSVTPRPREDPGLVPWELLALSGSGAVKIGGDRLKNILL